MGTRICHADADKDADTNGIRTEIIMSHSHLLCGKGHNNGEIMKRMSCRTRINIPERVTETETRVTEPGTICLC